MPHGLTPYLYSITSTICFILMQVFFKMLTQVIPQSIVLSTQAFFLLCLNSYILVSQQSYKKTYNMYDSFNKDTSQVKNPMTQPQNDHRFQIHITDAHRNFFRLLLKRLAINCLGVCVMSMALQCIPLSIVNSLFNTGPIMIFFIQAYFYNKPLSIVHLALTIVSFVGVLIVVNPFGAFEGQNQQEFWTLLLPIMSAVLASFGFVYLHELKGKVNQFIMLEYTYIAQVLVFHLLTNLAAIDGMPLLQAIPQSPGYFFSPSFTDPYCVGAFAISIILAYTANYYRVKSLFLLPPSKIAPLSYLGILLSLLIDVIVFGHKTNYVEIIGILLTSAGLLSHLVLEIIQSKEKNQRTDKFEYR